jgi:hypothetical protein
MNGQFQDLGMARRFTFLSFLLLATSAVSQSAEPRTDSTPLFQKVRTRLLTDVNRLPRYTCLQNIQRHFYHVRFQEQEKEACTAIIRKYGARKHELPLTSWDRLRLDVTIGDAREIHSWPGVSEFNENEIRKLVGGGPFGGGDFGPFISAIFGGNAKVKFQGVRIVEGRQLFEYTYEIASQSSQYHVETLSGPVVTAYGGSFFLDPQTTDIVRLTVSTAELPEITGACQALSEVDYGRMTIHGHEVLVPHETRLRMIDRDGKEALGITSYSSCHEYTSQTALRFDVPVSGPEGSSTQQSEPVMRAPLANRLPTGLRFTCRIVTPIDSDASAAGDPLEGILRSPIRDRTGIVLAPVGSHIRGRLVRLAEYKESLDYFEIGVRLESIQVHGAELRVSAALAHPEASPEHPVVTNAFEGIHLQSPDLPSALPFDVGAFFFTRAHLRLNHFDSEWVTVSPDVAVGSQSSKH